MPANRVAALVAVLTQIGVLCAAIAGAFPGRYGNALAAVAALLSHTATVHKFLDGAQKSEALDKRAERIHSILPAYGSTTSSGTTGAKFSFTSTASDLADEEIGDPDGAPSIPTTTEPTADGNDQVHA